jgi:hypothetical protein
MKTLRFSLHLCAVALVVLAFSSVASAQATRTWVSGVGDDANPCSRTAPCKTFAGAISKTAINGEIDCLDPGGFGAVTITKSITINCDAGPGGILPGVTNAININSAGSTVTIRGLDLQGVGQGVNGVNVIAAGTVHLVDMNIYGFTASGINVASGAAVTLTVEDVRIHDCAGSGILTNSSGGLVTADYSRVSIWSTANGVNAQNASRIQIHNSTFVGNGVGVNQTSLVSFGSVVTVFNSSFTGNGTAVQSISGASIAVSGNVFSTNSNVFNTNTGTINSFFDNVQAGNAAVGSVTNMVAIPKV